MTTMSTFAALYCSETGCAPRHFRRMIFWQTLPWYAVPIAAGRPVAKYQGDTEPVFPVRGHSAAPPVIAENPIGPGKISQILPVTNPT